MPQEFRYAGPVPSDASTGLHGGSCRLALAGGVFVLQLDRHRMYGIDDVDIVRGAATSSADGVRLDARTWQSHTDETTRVTAQRTLAASWHARPHPGAPGPAQAVLELRFGLAAESVDVLLLRQPARDATADPMLAAWFDDACAQRQARFDAERERHASAQEHARRGAESTPAFAARDYARVEALLAPIEAALSPAERQRLAMARKHLGAAGIGNRQ
jgi:hypothetical protein